MRLTKEQVAEIRSNLMANVAYRTSYKAEKEICLLLDALEAEIATHKAETAAILETIRDEFDLHGEELDKFNALISSDYAAALEERLNKARALAIREATDFVWENLQEDSGAEDLTYERDLCDRLLALLSTTHADAQAAHDKRVRLEIFEYLEPYIDPPTPSHTGPCNSESGCDGNCMDAAHFAEFVAELRAEPPSMETRSSK